jgi:hypothetical protein
MMLSSDIARLDQTSSPQIGGQIGVVAGGEVIRAKVNLLGYYASSENAAGSTDLYTSGASLDFYPLSWIFKRNFRLEPYFTGGLNYNRFKFFGYYLNRNRVSVSELSMKVRRPRISSSYISCDRI